MSTPSRPKNTSVIQHLSKYSRHYSFIQAIRLLERGSYFDALHENQNTNRLPVANFIPPDKELIRFHSNQALDFHSSELLSLNLDDRNPKSKQWRIVVNFMGLTGSMGVLPYHYTELILQRLKLKDKSLLNFLDLFNHRTISLFYQASVKYKVPIEYERKKNNTGYKSEKDTHTKVLLSLIGLGTKYLNDRFYTQDESLLFYSGLLSQQIKTSIGLKQILQHHFDIPVKINEFVGQWQPLINDVRTRLISNSLPQGQNACLGQSALIGRKAWFAQDKIRIVLGPLNRTQFYRFAPGTNTLKAINEIVQFYVGLECNYEFIIQIKHKDIPNRVKLNKNIPPILGWNAWLSKTRKDNSYNNKKEIVDIVVSATQLIKNY